MTGCSITAIQLPLPFTFYSKVSEGTNKTCLLGTGVGKMRPVRLRLTSASNNCRVKVRIWVRFRFRVRVRVRVRVGRLIQVA